MGKIVKDEINRNLFDDMPSSDLRTSQDIKAEKRKKTAGRILTGIFFAATATIAATLYLDKTPEQDATELTGQSTDNVIEPE